MTALEEIPDGLVYREEFISNEEEDQLLALLSSIEFRAVVMRGQAARRTVRHFGLDYDYESGELVPADPLPDSMLWLRDRCAALMERDSADLVQILVSRYPPGAGIGWHRDAELELAPRSAYLLAGKARWSWQHSIPAAKALRYSVTFRTLRRG